MARSRPVNGSPRGKGRQATRHRTKRVPSPDDIGQDPWSLPIGPRRDNARVSAVKSSSSVKATIKREVEEDDIAVPIPIGTAERAPRGKPLGKIVTADGIEQPFYQEIPGFVYQPIPGFEHCFEAPDPTPSSKQQDTESLGKSISSQQQVAHVGQPAHSVAARRGTALHRKSTVREPTVRKNLKRNRSYATLDSVRGEDNSVALVDADSGSDSHEGDKAVRVKLRPSCTFYIGNFEEVKKCLLSQLRDLNLRTVRSIVTAWIKYREPKRRNVYGAYHKKLPIEAPPECSPSWWPEDVQVNEPSHLSRDHVLKLAVDFLLVHRAIDQIKRKTPWVQTLRELALCTVGLIPEDSFSSSKNPTYDKEMRERATKHILPSLFDLAQSYEDHVNQYSLFEELNPTDPGTGREHTWQPVPKPCRYINRSNRARKRKIVEVVKDEDDLEALGDETEAEDAVANAFLTEKSVNGQKEVSLEEVKGAAVAVPSEAASTPEPAASAAPELDHSQSSANISFDGGMDYLGFGDGMDLDVKSGPFVPYNSHDSLRTMYSTSQRMQYPSSQPNFGHQSFLSQDNMASFSQSFGTSSTASFAHPCQVYNASTSSQPRLYHSSLRPAVFPNNTGSFYQYEHMFHLQPAADGGNESFNGLPMVPNYNDHTHRVE